MPYRTLYKDFSGVFLAPDKVGSSIRYNVEVTQDIVAGKPRGRAHLSCEINLTDCNRVISWYGAQEDILDKVNLAIKTLTKLKQSIDKSVKIMNKANANLE